MKRTTMWMAVAAVMWMALPARAALVTTGTYQFGTNNIATNAAATFVPLVGNSSITGDVTINGSLTVNSGATTTTISNNLAVLGTISGNGVGITNHLSFLRLGFTSFTPAQNTTRYAGTILTSPSLTLAYMWFEPPIQRPVVIKSAGFHLFVGGSLGTAGQAMTNWICSGASGTTVTSVWTNDCSATATDFVSTNLNITVSPGDKVAWRMDYPATWTAPPANLFGSMLIGFE